MTKDQSPGSAISRSLKKPPGTPASFVTDRILLARSSAFGACSSLLERFQSLPSIVPQLRASRNSGHHAWAEPHNPQKRFVSDISAAQLGHLIMRRFRKAEHKCPICGQCRATYWRQCMRFQALTVAPHLPYPLVTSNYGLCDQRSASSRE